MNKSLLWILGIVGVLVLACGMLGVGFAVGLASWGAFGAWSSGMMGPFTFGPFFASPLAQPAQTPGANDDFGFRMGPGMMGRGFWGRGPGRLGQGFQGLGPGMMGPGMMGGFGQSGLAPTEPLTIEQAEQAVGKFLEDLGNPDLVLHEVMIFDNHAYAEIEEQSTGIGAMEVLIDPLTLAVYPEHGPNMMWNLKYGMMSGYGADGMMRGMMGGFFRRGGTPTPPAVSAEMPVSPDQALAAAQEYLDTALPGTVAEEPEPFYGYYTLHILRDGKVIGMLSVNGYSAQVFPHTWHGDFIEMSEGG